MVGLGRCGASGALPGLPTKEQWAQFATLYISKLRNKLAGKYTLVLQSIEKATSSFDNVEGRLGLTDSSSYLPGTNSIQETAFRKQPWNC